MKRRFYTPADDAIIRKRYPYDNLQTLADDLDRTLVAITSRAQILGLRRNIVLRCVHKKKKTKTAS